MVLVDPEKLVALQQNADGVRNVCVSYTIRAQFTDVFLDLYLSSCCMSDAIKCAFAPSNPVPNRIMARLLSLMHSLRQMGSFRRSLRARFVTWIPDLMNRREA